MRQSKLRYAEDWRRNSGINGCSVRRTPKGVVPATDANAVQDSLAASMQNTRETLSDDDSGDLGLLSDDDDNDNTDALDVAEGLSSEEEE